MPADALALSVRSLWQAVAENKDLDLPAHAIMVALVRCSELAEAALAKLLAQPLLAELAKAQDGGQAAAPGLGAKLGALLGDCLEAYRAESGYFDERTRCQKEQELRQRALHALQPALAQQLALGRQLALKAAKATLAEQAGPARRPLVVSHSLEDCLNGDSIDALDQPSARRRVAGLRGVRQMLAGV